MSGLVAVHLFELVALVSVSYSVTVVEATAPWSSDGHAPKLSDVKKVSDSCVVVNYPR